MNRTLSVVLLGVTMLLGGCAICASPDDGTYAAYGGAWERDDRCCGRAGSTLSSAGPPVGRLSPPVASPSAQADPPAPRDEPAEDVPPRPNGDSKDGDPDKDHPRDNET